MTIVVDRVTSYGLSTENQTETNGVNAIMC